MTTALPTRLRLLALVGCGSIFVMALIALVGLPIADAALLVLYSGAGALAVAGACTVAGRRALRSVRGLLVLTALAPVAATVVGSSLAARAMFISDHDLRGLLIVLGSAGTVGVATAVALSDRVSSGTDAIAALARVIDGGPVQLDTLHRLPSELALVGAELEAVAVRLDDAKMKEAAMEASRRELVAWVSHDLRTPIAGIRAMSEALEDGVVDDLDTVARYHRTIRQEADRLTGLVDDLFELSRIQAGALRLDPERVPLADLVSDAVAGASVAAAAKGVQLEGTAASPSPMVELSTPEMSRVVRNLLDNAIRHTPAGGRVEVAASVSGDLALVSVRDACGGIAETDIHRVFDLAFRGDVARTPSDGRAGLGLAIAKGLVEAHAGSIDVQNVGDGCCFTVSLPVSAP